VWDKRKTWVYFFDAAGLCEVCVVEDLRCPGVGGVVDGELDAVDERVDLVELVQPHVHLTVDVLLKLVSATW